ncbi:DsrE family protein [Haloferax sp. DFSO60]|uniref:DsrE family protein n=1 Tax=Haloferax sp. DFSO60 TaxID=3388652 RepID=UPI00397C98CE
MNVVFHVSSGTVGDWKHALNNVRNLRADDTADIDQITLLANGDAVHLFLETSVVADRVEGLVESGVRCRACSNSLRSRDFDMARLVDGVEKVPSGVGELVKRQTAGDAYLKVP